MTVIARDYPHSLPDDTVLSLATTEARILITLDRDFGELIFQRHLPHAGVIYLRGMERLSTTMIISRVDATLRDHQAALDQRQYLTVTPHDIQVGLPEEHLRH